MWIIPKFETIFRDFGTALPPMTQWLIHVSYFFVNYWYFFSPLFLLFAWAARLRADAILRLDPVGFAGRWAGLVRRLDSAHVLDGLAVVARQQRPMAEGIATLAVRVSESRTYGGV